MRNGLAFVLSLAFALAACGEPERRGGLSPDEERRLDNAAKMLDDTMVFEASPEGSNEGAPLPPPANGQ